MTLDYYNHFLVRKIFVIVELFRSLKNQEMTDSPFTIELIPKIRHYITEEELTHIMEEEASSFNIFEFGRRLWVVLQSSLIYWWIYKGFKYYRAVQSSFMRAQWVLTM